MPYQLLEKSLSMQGAAVAGDSYAIEWKTRKINSLSKNITRYVYAVNYRTLRTLWNMRGMDFLGEYIRRTTVAGKKQFLRKQLDENSELSSR